MIKKAFELSNYTDEKTEYLSKIRFIKKNLIHVHGFPKRIANSNNLESTEYFGQYGTILKCIISYKIQPENNQRVYSAYITYSNEREAALAILCVDSLLIEGKIIRAFFGTTKYCNYFLKNIPCPYEDCWFLHNLANENDIIINDNTIFTYNDHLNLAKKIIDFSNPKTKNLIQKIKKPTKNVFPTIDFIFLKEEEKEQYFTSGNITYVKGNNKDDNNLLSINLIEYENNFDFNNYTYKKNLINNLQTKVSIDKNFTDVSNLCYNNNIDKSTIFNIISKENNNINKSLEPNELHNLFGNSIKHILKVRTFFSGLKNIPLRKLELDYLKDDLHKKGKDINKVLYGCLDCVNDII